MNIEEIISGTLIRLNQQQELRRLALLELLYKNIDGLIEHSESWFGDRPPSEYKKIIRSLMVISTTFLGEENDLREMVFDEPAEKVFLKSLINEILVELSNLDENKAIVIAAESGDSPVVTSIKKMKTSLESVLLSFMVFMDTNSRCTITLRESKTSVILSLAFSDLLSSFPGVDKIQKAFFSYFFNGDYRIGIGIDFALYTLRNIGSVARVTSTSFGDSGALVEIVFPSLEFQEVVNEIRSAVPVDVARRGNGLVLLLTDDLTLEMVLGEMLREYGYRMKKIDPDRISSQDADSCRAVIADFTAISARGIDPGRFRDCFSGCGRVVIIHGPDLEGLLAEYQGPGVALMKKPFDLDRIARALEGDDA